MNKVVNRSYLLLAIKIFFIGLIVHFFAYTFVTFGLGIQGGIINVLWIWKELWILGGIGLIARSIREQKNRKHMRSVLPIKHMLIASISGIALVGLIGIIFTPSSITDIILSLRYNYTGFIVMIISFILGWRYIQAHDDSIIQRCNKILKYLLIGAVLRWIIIYFVPGLLKFAGYNKEIFEGEIGMAPPAAYYTNFNQGYTRNQFLFERPTSRGFFLVAFWPLFYVLSIRNKGRLQGGSRGALYLFNIIITFSRAAGLAWIIQTIVMLILEHRKQLYKMLIYYLLPIIAIVGTVVYVGREQIIYRNFSNLGHIQHTLKAVQKVAQKPIVGWGPASAGPASHHSEQSNEYNPENQFLTIWIEYGLIGFGFRMYLYLRMHRIGVQAYDHMEEKRLSKEDRKRSRMILSMSIGLLGLSICGLFLHSFIDRMIVYPFMMMTGIIRALYHKNLFVHDKTKVELP